MSKLEEARQKAAEAAKSKQDAPMGSKANPDDVEKRVEAAKKENERKGVDPKDVRDTVEQKNRDAENAANMKEADRAKKEREEAHENADGGEDRLSNVDPQLEQAADAKTAAEIQNAREAEAKGELFGSASLQAADIDSKFEDPNSQDPDNRRVAMENEELAAERKRRFEAADRFEREKAARREARRQIPELDDDLDDPNANIGAPEATIGDARQQLRAKSSTAYDKLHRMALDIQPSTPDEHTLFGRGGVRFTVGDLRQLLGFPTR